MKEFINNEIENLESDLISFAVTYHNVFNKMVDELRTAIKMHKDCLLRESKKWNREDKNLKDCNRIITQKKMNEIIDNKSAEYPEGIFPRPTYEETRRLPHNMREYIGRLSANMARSVCGNIKKELDKYFEDINNK